MGLPFWTWTLLENWAHMPILEWDFVVNLTYITSSRLRSRPDFRRQHQHQCPSRSLPISGMRAHKTPADFSKQFNSQISDSQKPECPISARAQTLTHKNVERQISTDDGGAGPDFKWVAGSVEFKSRLINKSQIASSTRHVSRRVGGNLEHIRLQCEGG